MLQMSAAPALLLLLLLLAGPPGGPGLPGATLTLVGASRAPDQAPDLPAGWCKGGTPTRTTGECMCPQECRGSHCKREQGFVWYSGADCPTCECVKQGEAASSDSGSGSSAAAAQKAPAAARANAGANAGAGPQPAAQRHLVEEKAEPAAGDLSTDPLLLLQEWCEDNVVAVFVGVVATVVALACFAMIVLRDGQKGEEAEQRAARAAKEQTQAPAAAAAASAAAASRKQD